jgi:hypothetical protein
MLAEIEKLERYKVWRIVKKTQGMRILDARWVYTQKPTGWKARWVAKGYRQVEGIDNNETHAAVAHKDTHRVFLSFVHHFDLHCNQLDIVSAFLNGDLEEEIHVYPPELSGIPDGHVLLLNKSLYGTIQAPRCFNKKFNAWMRKQGFEPSKADPCLYIRRKGGNLIILTVHVDDQLITSNNRAALDKFKLQLNSEFECKDMGPAQHFLGFDIHRYRLNRKLYISQEKYLKDVLQRFDMEDCNPVKHPLPAGFQPIAATDAEHQQVKYLPYAQIVDSILYASIISQPDLAHPAGVLSRFLSKWNKLHFKAAKNLLRYIQGTLDLCLTFDGKSAEQTLLGYVDADWGGDMDTRRSTTGYVFKVYGGVVAWKSRCQPTVALSTTKAEYMASADATQQAIWLKLLLSDLGIDHSNPVPLFNNNQGTIALSKNPVHHKRSKHILLRHHFLREKVENQSIELAHIPSAENIADLLTKALPGPTFERLRGLLGLADKGELKT